MTGIQQGRFYKQIASNLPIILLFISVLNEFDFNYFGFDYFSFNFPYILLFYWSLKKSQSLGYGLIFIAGLVNDVVLSIPLGVSSLSYLLICGFAAYLRNITLRPNLIKDWIFFLITISFLNFITFSYLILLLKSEVNYFDQMINIFFTFIFYLIFSYFFKFYDNIILGRYH